MTNIPVKRCSPWLTVSLVVALTVLPLLACAGGVVMGAALVSSESPGLSMGRGDAVAVLFADGVITSGRAGSPSGSVTGITPWRIRADLRRAEADPSVRAVVMHVNSPGGSVVASNEIHRMVKEFHKPVVFYFGETAASGGYYIACAGKWIVANPDTLTGSIGVISELTDASELLKKIGVEFVVIKTGPNKDIGSFARPMTDEEKKIFQAVIDQAYDGFVKVIAQGRGLPEDKVRRIGDGRIYSGQQALELGLVDQLGYLDDAVAKAGELGGMAGKPRVIEYTHTPSLVDIFMGAASRAPAFSLDQLIGLDAAPRLEYRFVNP